MIDKDVTVEINEEEFELQVTFRDIAPLTEDTSEELAQSILVNMSRVMSSRVTAYMRLLDLIARRGTDEHWRELDVCITTMAALLEETGLDGALERIIPGNT